MFLKQAHITNYCLQKIVPMSSGTLSPVHLMLMLTDFNRLVVSIHFRFPVKPGEWDVLSSINPLFVIYMSQDAERRAVNAVRL